MAGIFFLGGFVLLVVMAIEELAFWLGHSLLGYAYSPQTFLEVATVLFVIGIAFLLRQIRDELRRRNLRDLRHFHPEMSAEEHENPPP